MSTTPSTLENCRFAVSAGPPLSSLAQQARRPGEREHAVRARHGFPGISTHFRVFARRFRAFGVSLPLAEKNHRRPPFGLPDFREFRHGEHGRRLFARVLPTLFARPSPPPPGCARNVRRFVFALQGSVLCVLFGLQTGGNQRGAGRANSSRKHVQPSPGLKAVALFAHHRNFHRCVSL